MSEYQINMVCCTDVLLQDIDAKEMTQRDIAFTYAMAIKSQAQKTDIPDWNTINKAIIARWNFKALDRIKKRAFDILEGRIQP